MPALLFAAVLALLLVPGPGGSEALAQERPLHTVLAVHWSTEDFPTSVVTEEGIRSELLSQRDSRVDYFAEYLESDRFPADRASVSLRDYIAQKYAGRRIDVVLAISDASLEFVRRYRNDLFPSTPIVYLGYASPETALRESGSGLTGIILSDGFRATLDLALAVHPNAARVHVVANRSDGRLDEMVDAELRQQPGRVPISFLRDLSTTQLLSAVAAVPARDLVLFVRHSQEIPGAMVYPAAFARLVAEASAVPVYGISENYLGTGVVGGAVFHRRENGVRLAQMARQILNGTHPRDIPLERAPLVPVFDWRQLERWDIDRSRLPAEARLLFQSPTLWQMYGWRIGAIVLVIACQGVFIALLAVQRRRLRDEKARSSAILHAIPDVMFLLTRDGRYVDFHAPDPAKLPVEPSRFLGRSVRDVLPPDVAQLFESRFALLTPGLEPVLIEYTLETREGARHFEARLVASHGDQVLTMVRDITERKLSERTLHDTQIELDRVSRLTALGEFAMSMAHELGQPLTAIIANARASLRLLATGRHDVNEITEALTDVVDAGERASEVIQRNRELFRDHAVRLAPVSIGEVIQEVAVLARGRLQVSEVALVTSLGPDLPAVNGDRIELQQVLLNLIVNGIDAMEATEPPLRRLDISADPAASGFVQISVRDNGIGLGNVDLDRMFTLSYTTKAGGSGVGLSISRSIVEAHGGELWAAQNPEGGATFSFTIPTLGAFIVASGPQSVTLPH